MSAQSQSEPKCCAQVLLHKVLVAFLRQEVQCRAHGDSVFEVRGMRMPNLAAMSDYAFVLTCIGRTAEWKLQESLTADAASPIAPTTVLTDPDKDAQCLTN